MRNLLRAAALSAALMFGASAASATTYTVTNVAMNTSPPIVHLNDGVINEDAYMGPMDFTVDGVANLLRVFCINMDRNISLGAQAPNFQFTTMTLDQYFPTFTSAQLGQIAYLVTTGLAQTGSNANAYQGGIWEKISPKSVTAYDFGTQFSVDALAGSPLMANYGSLIVLKSQNGSQDMITGVPEPAQWAMLILGFGMVGMMTRRRSQATAFAA